MTILINPETGEKEFTIPGIIHSVSETIREAGEKKTPYRWAKVDIEYPNGKKDRVDATLWEKLYTHENCVGAFEVGNTVELTTQLEGKHAGRSKVSLPTAQKVDVTQFAFAEEAIPIAEVEEVA